MLDILNKINFFDDQNLLFHDVDIKRDKPLIISFCNAHAVNMAAKNDVFKADLLSADFLLRDGSGLKIAMKVMGMHPGLNLNGTDFIPAYLAHTTGQALAIFGTKEPWLSDAVAKIGETHDVVACIDGFQEISAYIEAAQKHKPSIILLAMGMPKQEGVARALAENLNHPVTIINGGAIIDFIAQRFERAPEWMRKVGMEWVFRLFKEPQRLFKRYIIGNFVFLFGLGLCYLKNIGK